MFSKQTYQTDSLISDSISHIRQISFRYQTASLSLSLPFRRDGGAVVEGLVPVEPHVIVAPGQEEAALAVLLVPHRQGVHLHHHLLLLLLLLVLLPVACVSPGQPGLAAAPLLGVQVELVRLLLQVADPGHPVMLMLMLVLMMLMLLLTLMPILILLLLLLLSVDDDDLDRRLSNV